MVSTLNNKVIMRWLLGVLILFSVTSVFTSPAQAASDAALQQLQTNIDFVWTMIAAALVLSMQGGFLLLEAGLVRSKNSISVAQKNLADLILCGLFFGAVGYMLMFGESAGGWFGWDGTLFLFAEMPDWTAAFFIFQLVFCGTAATIVSGAVAERMAFTGYLSTTALIALLIYPVFGHWAWGNLLVPDNPAFLADRGFIDFAGSTVVHATGAWVALAAIIVIGPRLGRFEKDGTPVRFIGHNPVLAAMGTVILFVGWIGFNGGSTTAGTPQFAQIISNTVVAALAGGFIGLVLGRFLDYVVPANYSFIDERGRFGAPFAFVRLGWTHGYFRPERMINGLLGGLVAITAGCDAVTNQGALAIGALGAIAATLGSEMLERWFKLDDVVGAISVHGFAGACGTIALAIFATPEALVADSRWAQFLAQCEGVILNFVWAFGIAYVALRLIDGVGVFGRLRVSRESEFDGLNVSEHATRLGTGEVVRALKGLADGEVDFRQRLDDNVGDESGELAGQFNRIMDGLVGDMVKGTQQLSMVSKKLEAASVTLSRQAEVTAGHAQSVASTTGTVAGQIDQVETAVSDVQQGADDIHRSATSIRDLTARAADGVEAFAEGLSRVSNNSEHAGTVSQQALTEAKSAQESMDRLRQVTASIEAILDLVKGIAGQTNLLALNASIEAARAGPAGRGFAIVASEIKGLAAKTSDAVDQITKMVGNIGESADEVDRVVQQVSGVIGSLHGSMAAIAQAVEKQSDLTRDVRQHFTSITEELSSVTDHASSVSRSSQHVLETAHSAHQGTNDVLARIRDVSDDTTVSLREVEQLTGVTREVSSVVRDLEGVIGGRGSGRRTGAA